MCTCLFQGSSQVCLDNFQDLRVSCIFYTGQNFLNKCIAMNIHRES